MVINWSIFFISIVTMKVIEEAFEPITGYLISIERDTVHGWYFLKVGIPKGWVFNENGEISCEIITETTNGKLIQISPKNEGVVIDDLVDFIKKIIKIPIRYKLIFLHQS